MTAWLRRLLPRAARRTGPARGRYAGDFRGVPDVRYAPHPNGLADPGEVVWAWVPFAEDPRRGKDRPVLIIGQDGSFLLGLMLTSKDHDRDAAEEARRGRFWLDIGSGGWDAQRRPSEVRLDRIIRLRPAEVRREGASLPRGEFDRIVDLMLKVRAGR